MTRQIDLQPLIVQVERYLAKTDDMYNSVHARVKELRINPTVSSDILDIIVSTCIEIIHTNGGSHEHVDHQIGMNLARRDLLTKFTYTLPSVMLCGWSEFSGDLMWPIRVPSLPGAACQQHSTARNTHTAFIGEYGAANYRLCEYLIATCNRLLENPVIDFSPEGSDYW